MKFSRFLFLFVALGVMLFAFAGGTEADDGWGESFLPDSTVNVSEDVYISPSSPTTNQNGGLLFTQFGTGPDQRVLLKFDLTGVTHVIDKARLAVAPINDSTLCFINSTAGVMPSVYAVADDTWAEGTVTFNTAPARGALVSGPSATSWNAVTNHFGWTDETATGFASWLESERLGDGVASVWVEITSGGFGDQFVFADKENAGVCGFSFAGGEESVILGDVGPFLQLAGPGNPLAVDLSSTEASNSSSNFMWIWGGMIAVLMAATSLVILKRKNQEVTTEA